ncbi:MAG: nucleotidyltransferase domain-containing protein [Candidatus Woesearchaeota archaeon]
METYKLKFTTLQLEIFRLFCIKTGQKLNQRKIAKFLNVSPTAIAKALPLLEKEGLLKINNSKEMNLTLVEFNRENKLAIQLKRVENLKLFYESGILNNLIEQYPGTTIILFGSYAKGEDLFTSDIDVAIIGTKKKGSITKDLEKEVRVSTYLNSKEINKELKENIFNGIVLIGGIEL